MLRMILPVSAADAVKQCAADPALVLKGGGTDVMDRHNGGYLAPAGVVQLRSLPGLAGITRDGGAFRLGALTTLGDVLRHEELGRALPLVKAAIAHTATPQVRNLATVGGSLCQRPRCWYLRNPEFECRKKGGSTCFAIEHDNTMHAIFDNDACAAVHPSTMGAVILALDATLEVRVPGADAARTMTAAELFTFDLRDPTIENGLPHGALIEAVRVPASTGTVRHAHERASPRLLADWPAVEVCVALAMNGDVVADARVVLGGVSRTPRRANTVEDALKGKRLDATVAADAAKHAADGATPLDFNRYKVQLACNTTEAALQRVLA